MLQNQFQENLDKIKGKNIKDCSDKLNIINEKTQNVCQLLKDKKRLATKWFKEKDVNDKIQEKLNKIQWKILKYYNNKVKKTNGNSEKVIVHIQNKKILAAKSKWIEEKITNNNEFKEEFFFHTLQKEIQGLFDDNFEILEKIMKIMFPDSQNKRILLKDDEKKKIKKIKNNYGKYEGETLRIIEGKGKFIYNNGDEYEGLFKNNKREGEGFQKYANNESYKGMFKNDMKDGKGIYKYNNGDSFSGIFKEDKREGEGIYYYSNGDVYRGEFKDDNKYGKCTLEYVNGDNYKGLLDDDKRHGEGILKYANGDVYEGSFKNDRRDGKGVLKYANEDYFEGEFKNDKREGKGTQKYINGDRYRGDFKDDKKEGWGNYWYANTEWYEGWFKNDKREGEGFFSYLNGDRYNGLFRDDKKEGEGRIRYSNGDVYECVFINNAKGDKGKYIRAGVEVIKEDFKYNAEPSIKNEKKSELLSKSMNGRSNGKMWQNLR